MDMRKLCITVVCLLAAVPQGHCGTVLATVLPGPLSHLFGMKKVAEEIAARGNIVKFLAVESDVAKLHPTDISILTYTIQVKEGDMDPSSLKLLGPQTFLKSIGQIMNLFENACSSILANYTLMAQLKEYNAELMLGETMSPCTQVLAAKLDVPFVNFWLAGPIEPFATSLWRGSNRRAFTPNPLAYFPQMETGIQTQHMNFVERMQNFVKYWHFQAQDFIMVRPLVQGIFRRFLVDPDDPRERQRVVMTLCIADFAVEWLRPMPPNFKLIGPVLPEPARPLPADLEAFMEGAGDNGVLLVAMGTVATLGLRERQAMAAAFAQLPGRVLWRLSKSEVPNEAAVAELRVGNNTKVATWLPQNDVLGHPRTRAFLSHCGVNGLYEAAYHGVPIVALPFFADQPANADKAVARGFALRLSHADIGTKHFRETIQRVLTEPGFAAAAKGLSLKLRTRPRSPTQEAADWVEHVLATGGEAYLRTPDDDLPLLVRLSLDVWAACLGAAAVLVYTAFLLARLLLAKLGAPLFGSGLKAKAA